MNQELLYNGSLTAEQFLFSEIRIASKYYLQGMPIKEVVDIIKKGNLFQYPTERQVSRLARACYKRLDALSNVQLVHAIAFAPNDIAPVTKCFTIFSTGSTCSMGIGFLLNVKKSRRNIGDCFSSTLRVNSLNFS